MADINFTYADLRDMLERYPLKARSTTSTNNATPAYITTIISGVKTAFRRITGQQATDETLGDLLWLNLQGISDKNMSEKDRPLFEGQESVKTGHRVCTGPVQASRMQGRFRTGRPARDRASSWPPSRHCGGRSGECGTSGRCRCEGGGRRQQAE